ncbi:MAG TPA: oxygenase MpaB family protein [Anaerolineales bacterium]|nr:oxygenase MpaB family protein [Anaerolineales bacterium]
MATKWTDQLLDSMRQETDPVADKVVAAMIASHGLETYNAMLRELVNNRDEIPSSLPKIVHEYFEKTQVLPDWANREKIACGEDVFVLHGPEMVAMLLFAALPSSYGMASGANVLAITAQLTGHVYRRIFRTAQFIADIMQSGGLGPNGRGIRSTQKVRLIHASIRYYIKHKAEWKSQWNPEWGEPVNQEDLASTLLDFFVGILKGVRKMGIRLTPEEVEAYHHCWKVVGYMMGIRPELLTETPREAFELAEIIAARQMRESKAGEELTRDLIKFAQGPMPPLLRGLPATAIRYFSGEKVARVIKTGPYNWTLSFLYLQIFLLRSLDTFRRDHPRLQKYIRFLTWNIMDKILLHEEGKAFTFEIPEELRAAWRLPARRRKIPAA